MLMWMVFYYLYAYLLWGTYTSKALNVLFFKSRLGLHSGVKQSSTIIVILFSMSLT